MTPEPITLERSFNAPLSKIWKALTDSKEMKKWYFDIEDFRTEVGFEFHFTAGSEQQKYTHLCKVTEVIPEKRLSYSWRYENYAGNSEVTFELFAEGGNTRLKLTHSGIETFPQGSRDFARESFTAGWTHIIGISLKDYLEATA
ncbi:MAG: SRPBCC domain-containing protein [Bacteroidota bacterium]|nr:SRPBCC domain-containing protein [Bacteroidota bacterium]MDP4231139.1 SRPBCC domain-containing protein [Bacteroidota bacterium]MDP4235552.1 SRPBCC domain-containing protein [Bacteroidota bacterium]